VVHLYWRPVGVQTVALGYICCNASHRDQLVPLSSAPQQRWLHDHSGDVAAGQQQPQRVKGVLEMQAAFVSRVLQDLVQGLVEADGHATAVGEGGQVSQPLDWLLQVLQTAPGCPRKAGSD